MRTKKLTLIHEVGHLLFFLKNMTTVTEIFAIEKISVGTIQLERKNIAGMMLLNTKYPTYSETIAYFLFGGMVADIHFKKMNYRKVNIVSAIHYGWLNDIKLLKEFNTWKNIRENAWKMSKSITKEDENFIFEIISLFKKNTKTLEFDQMLPVIVKYFPKIKEFVNRNPKIYKQNYN